jgi:hypothetical protein
LNSYPSGHSPRPSKHCKRCAASTWSRRQQSRPRSATCAVSIALAPDNERSAITKLEMCSLQLGPLAANDRPVLAPIELESFPRLENQWNKRTLLRLPHAGKGGDTAVGTGEPQRHQIGVQLLHRALLLARPTALHLQPIAGLETPSGGSRSITPCRSLRCPPLKTAGVRSEHGQFSMEIRRNCPPAGAHSIDGSVPDGTQHAPSCRHR